MPTVTTAKRVQVVKPRKPVATRVHLEDHGQDFTEWDLDEDGLVIDARPHQAEIWRGVAVVNHRTLRIGGALALRLVDGSERMLDYRAAGVMRMPRPEQGRARPC